MEDYSSEIEKNNPLMEKNISFRDDFYFLSNLYECNITYKGKEFKSSEHLYQYLKVKDTKDGEWWKEKIRNAEHPKIAKKLAENANLPHKFDIYEELGFKNVKEMKISFMKIALFEKFYNSKEKDILQKMLIETSPITLIERNTWKDIFWGVYYATNKGENNLGKLLMNIREDLLNELKLNNNKNFDSDTQNSIEIY